MHHEFSDVVKRRLPLMSEAIPSVGHRQTRNCGTIGGSLCHLDPSAELPLVPNVERLRYEALSPLNPVRRKGVGKVSVVSATSVIASAIDNALSPFGIRVRETPISPILLLELPRKH
jgi:FAD binding domain in molybdopterin dehydrogenase